MSSLGGVKKNLLGQMPWPKIFDVYNDLNQYFLVIYNTHGEEREGSLCRSSHCHQHNFGAHS
jgi:hypothetical protein